MTSSTEHHANKPKPCAVLFVDDVRKTTQFYKHVAHMTVLHEAADHVVLELDGMGGARLSGM